MFTIFGIQSNSVIHEYGPFFKKDAFLTKEMIPIVEDRPLALVQFSKLNITWIIENNLNKKKRSFF